MLSMNIFYASSFRLVIEISLSVKTYLDNFFGFRKESNAYIKIQLMMKYIINEILTTKNEETNNAFANVCGSVHVFPIL